MKFGIPVTAMVAMVPIVISEEETARVIAYQYTLYTAGRAVIGLLGAGLSVLAIMLRTEC